MAEDVGQAYVGIVPSLKGFSSRLRAELATELRGIDAPIAGAGHRAGAAFGDSMRAGIGSRLASIGAMLKTGLVIGGAAVAAGLGAVTLFGLRSAAALEQTQIGFESLLGSAQEATEFIGELQEFAAQTPFEFAGIADASRRILAFGGAVGITREDVIPTISTIGDLAAVLGVGQTEIDSVVRALGQMASKGRVLQGEILQLSDALPGFNANAAIAAHLGLSTADALELMERGGVSAQTGIEGILEGMRNFRGAAGAMERQSQTLLGVFSTFKDTISIALTEAFQPVIPAIKESLLAITPILGEAIGSLAPVLGQVLATALPLLASFIQALVPVISPIIDGLRTGIEAIASSGALQAVGDALGSVAAALAPILPILGQAISEVLLAAAPHLEEMAPIIAELVPPLGELLLALVPLIPALIDLATATVPLATVFAPLVADLLSLLTAVGVVPLIQSLAAAVGFLTGKVEDLAGWLGNIDWRKTWNSIVGGLSTAWNAVVGFFQGLPGQIGQFLSELPSRAADALNQMAYLIGLALGRTIVFFRDLPGRIWTAISGLAVRLATAAADAGVAFRNAIVSRVDEFVAFLRGLPQRAWDALLIMRDRLVEAARIMVDRALQIGRDIVNGIISGIRATIGGVGRVLMDGLSSAYHGVLDGLGISSPSKVYAEVGEDVIAGYIQGVEQSARSAAAATMGALAPTSAASTGAAPAPQVATLTSSDPLMSAFLSEAKEQIRRQFGGDVVFALGTTS